MGALAAVRSFSSGFWLHFLGEADGRLAVRKVPLADAPGTRFEYVRPGRRTPGEPAARADDFAPFAAYRRQRLAAGSPEAVTMTARMIQSRRAGT